MTGWQCWVDRGGTFTDIVARRPDGRPLTHKPLSDDPAHYADAAVAGVRELLHGSTDPVDAVRVIEDFGLDAVQAYTRHVPRAVVDAAPPPAEPLVAAVTADRHPTPVKQEKR